MKKLLIILAMVMLSGCAGIGTIVPSSPNEQQQVEIRNKRFLKVAIVSDEFRPVMLNATKKAFKILSEKYGIEMGAYTFISVSLKGGTSIKSADELVAKQIVPLGPKTADIFIVFLPGLLWEDAVSHAIGLAAGGSPPPLILLGFSESFFQRFAYIRVPTAQVVSHEIEHLFGANDIGTPNGNLKRVLASKWTKFDGWYIRNLKGE